MIGVELHVNYAKRAASILGLLVAVIGLAACDGIVEIVPFETPIPQPNLASQATDNQTSPQNSAPPSRIMAEAIDLDAPIVEMGWRAIRQGEQLTSEWEMPDNEAAWHRNSARPGEGSNVVISGHNASTGGQVFADLDELQVGDEITIWNDQDKRLIYQVTEKNIVRTFAASEEAQSYLLTATSPTNQEQLTLITCWPRWTNTHRLIVVAKPKQG